MSVSFEELEGSPRFEVRDDETVAIRFFRVGWIGPSLPANCWAGTRSAAGSSTLCRRWG